MGRYKQKASTSRAQSASLQIKSLSTLEMLDKRVKDGYLTEEQAIEIYAVRSLDNFKQYCFDKKIIQIY